MSVKSLLPNEVTQWRLSLWPSDEIIAIFIYLQYYEMSVCGDTPEKNAVCTHKI